MDSSMNGWLLMILWSVGIFVGNATEIVAWKVPLIRYFDEAGKRGGGLISARSMKFSE
jgi:hypothetical protein